jgi:serine/threonine protein kinase
VSPTALGGICLECMLEAGLATQTEAGPMGPHGTKTVPPPPPKPEEIAPLFPQLEILECLGRGGMGAVYRARQPRLDRFVALKILGRDKEDEPQFAERFVREARALARLNHPNIVTVYDFGEAGGHCYLLMEYVDGLSLRQLLQGGRLPPEQALTIVPKICEALQFAHEQGVVHRDIKPENILLDKNGRVKIADFGIAKMVGAEGAEGSAGRRAGAGGTMEAEAPDRRSALPASLTQDQVVGTPHYMAPEQVEKPATVDHRADIYSLGVVFYEMLTGELPLGKFAPPSSRTGGIQIDVRLDEVVLHALEKEPELRYQQASQIKSDLDTIVAGGPESKVPPSLRSDAAAQRSKSNEVPTAGGTRSWMGFPFVEERDGKPIVLWIGVAVAWVVQWAILMLVIPLSWVAAGDWLNRFISLPGCLGIGTLVATALVTVGVWRTRALVMAGDPWPGGRRQTADECVPAPATAGPQRLSRTAIVGAAWIGLFFLNGIAGYTPPGWSLRHFLRNTPFDRASELILFLPLMVLGFAAVAGASVMGGVALHQIRQARGALRGWRLALFDVLFFPLLLANGWAAWLVTLVISQISSAGPAAGRASPIPSPSIAALVLLGLLLNGLLIRAAARIARQFVNSPAPPARPPVMGTWPQVFKAAARRLVLVIVVQLALFETLEQVSVPWKESSSELWGIALAVATLGGLAWACWPGYRLRQSWRFWGGGIVISSLLLLGLDNLYAWHLRPNLGLHREADWVGQHPGFQWGSRQGLAANLWRQAGAKPFGPPIEMFLPLDAEHPVALCDLDTGRHLSPDAFDVENPETTSRARKEMLDLALLFKHGQVTVLGLDLGVGWVPHFVPAETLTSQAAVNFWSLDRRKPKAVDTLQVSPSLITRFVYRTREGGVGVCELGGLSDTPPGVKLRLRQVPEMPSIQPNPAPEPPLRITGTVTDAATGKPIAGARVDDNRYGASPTRAPLQAWTDATGRYELKTWYEEHTIAASAPGYEPRLATLFTRPFGTEREKRMDFQLQPALSAPKPSLLPPAPVPPVVIQTVPPSGAADVDSGLTELRATFNKPMQDGSWSWCRWADGNEENFPRLTGSARYLEDGRTCVLPVKLQPGRTYALWLNHPDSARSFRDTDGQAAVPYLLIFETRK